MLSAFLLSFSCTGKEISPCSSAPESLAKLACSLVCRRSILLFPRLSPAVSAPLPPTLFLGYPLRHKKPRKERLKFVPKIFVSFFAIFCLYWKEIPPELSLPSGEIVPDCLRDRPKTTQERPKTTQERPPFFLQIPLSCPRNNSFFII